MWLLYSFWECGNKVVQQCECCVAYCVTWPGVQNTKFGDEDAWTSCRTLIERIRPPHYNYLLSNLSQLQVTKRRSGSAGRILLNITDKYQKCAVLLHLVGAEVQTIFMWPGSQFISKHFISRHFIFLHKYAGMEAKGVV